MPPISLKFDHAEYLQEALVQSIGQILEENTLLAISTVKGKSSHIATAFYCFSERLDFYILADPSSQSVMNLRTNASAALAIYDSRSLWGQPKRELQVFGTCRPAEGEEVQEVTQLYQQRFSDDASKLIGRDGLNKGTRALRYYVIRPSSITLFDELTFGPETYIKLPIGQ